MPTMANVPSTRETSRVRRPFGPPAGLSVAVLMETSFRIPSRRPLGGRVLLEAAAERAYEIDRQVEPAVAQVGLQVFLLQHLRLRGEHLQVIAEAGAIARHRDAVGFLGGSQAGLRFGALDVGRAQRR